MALAYQLAGLQKGQARHATTLNKSTKVKKRASSVAVEAFLKLNPPRGMMVNPALKQKIVLSRIAMTPLSCQPTGRDIIGSPKQFTNM